MASPPPDRPTAAAFLDAIAQQVARHYAAGLPPPAASVAAARDRARAVLHELDLAAGADRLLTEPPMLAAFFGNLDLLFEHGDPGADRAALLVMTALERLDGSG